MNGLIDFDDPNTFPKILNEWGAEFEHRILSAINLDRVSEWWQIEHQLQDLHIGDNSVGPYIIKDTIGPGHNPEIFKAKNGQYVVYVIDGYYLSDSLDGPWKYGKFKFNPRDRKIIEGLSNLTFTKREDGSNLMICRGGGVWISRTGLSEYSQISNKRAYPAVDGEFEDPVVWKDNAQYHLIVNDWLGRIAFYLRSKDGVNWVTDPGEAYLPGVISKHKDGHCENWFKYERIKLRLSLNVVRATLYL